MSPSLYTIVDKIATKLKLPASEVTNWIRTKICFALIRSLVLCLRVREDEITN